MPPCLTVLKGNKVANNLTENRSVNLEIFKHIDSVVEMFEQKRDVYKLIAEEIQEYFETAVFSKSRYSLSMVHRIKTSNSIREKLVRNSYISPQQFSRFAGIQN